MRVAVQSTVWLALMAAVLLVAAGSWRWTEGWTFIAIFAVGSVGFVAWMRQRDPALLAARLGPLIQREQPVWDRVFLLGFVTLWFVWLALMAADAQRWRSSHVPALIEALGALLVVGGFAATLPVFAANSFAAPVVRVQLERAQRVVDRGPYALVRHPMYAAASLYLVGMPLLLGSWYGLIGSALFIAGVSLRAVGEERELRRELAGYAEYMERVRYRMLPGVW